MQNFVSPGQNVVPTNATHTSPFLIHKRTQPLTEFDGIRTEKIANRSLAS